MMPNTLLMQKLKVVLVAMLTPFLPPLWSIAEKIYDILELSDKMKTATPKISIGPITVKPAPYFKIVILPSAT